MSNRFSDSCYYYAMLGIASKMAQIQGFKEDAKTYLDKANVVKNAIKSQFIDGDNVDTNGQGSLATALYFGIVEGEQAEKIAKKLVGVLKKDNYKFKVGILGIKSLLNALSKYGYTEEAFKAVAREDYPSYGYWKKLGMTTLGERWEGDFSRNHHMFGDVVNWIIRNVAGLQNAGVAYSECVLKPYFYADECSASCYTQTPYGKLSFSWSKKGKNFTAKASIPKGVCAQLVLGEQAPVKLESGEIYIKKNVKPN